MKKLLFLIFISGAFESNAQNYLISFMGTGASTTVNTVKVENLTAGKSIILNGSDILHLTIPTGINSTEGIQPSGLKVYPNPMIDNSILEIFPPIAGDATISVCDITGKMLAQVSSNLNKGLQEFHLSGFKSGYYLISVYGTNYRLSGKLLCNSKSDGAISIEKINNNQAVDGKILRADSKGVQANIDMAYTTGDRLKFTGISGNYSTFKISIPTSDQTITFNFIGCTDYDNNNYSIVEIGTQVWMAENLKTTKYRNGDLIGTTTPAALDISGENAPKYQWAYEGNESNVATYGRLYTWYAATDSRNVCPSGWHVPTYIEWNNLIYYYDSNYPNMGGILKETGTIHWLSPNTGATNESGFTGLPGGNRFNNSFTNIFIRGSWWTSTLDESFVPNSADGKYLFYDNGSIPVTPATSRVFCGFSIRCIKDN